LTAAGDAIDLLHAETELQPSMADLYRSRVEELAAALQREETRLEASEKCVQRSIEIRGLRWNFRPPRR
jgi:hypothetical protein